MNTNNSSTAVNKALRVKRACALCDAGARELQKLGIHMVTITPQLYTHDGEHRVVKMCRGVSICEDCFGIVLAGQGRDVGGRQGKFHAAISERLRSGYNAMLEASLKDSE